MAANALETPSPGSFIREELIVRGWTQHDLAVSLGVTEQDVEKMASVGPAMARKLGEVFDVPPEFFDNLQAAYEKDPMRGEDMVSFSWRFL